MAEAVQIEVYASLPKTVATGDTLDADHNNWHWVHCLLVPQTVFNLHFKLSLKPYKWIRYASGVVVGAQGVLCTSQNLQDAVDENAELPPNTIKLYYHVDDLEKQKIFPLDPNFASSRVTSSTSTPRRSQFRDAVAGRDDNRCILSDSDRYCEAAHLLDRTKGDKYISEFTRRRSRDSLARDIIEDIDDIRNGLYLHIVAHAEFGKYLGFLITPNFAMNTTDIDLSASPTEKRYTPHCFRPLSGNPLNDLPSGTKVRIANENYPPDILFDAVYASVVLYNFGTQDLKDSVNHAWREILRPDYITRKAQAEHQVLDEERNAIKKKEVERAESRRARFKDRYRTEADGPDTFDMLMLLPYIKVPPQELREAMRKAEEEAEQAEQARVQEKVNTWRGKIIP